MSDSDFFDKADPQQIVKTRMVSEYFVAWKNIILRTLGDDRRPLAYADLFSGPGRFQDGTPSTPLLILQTALDDERLRTRLRMTFNDLNPRWVARLSSELDSMNSADALVNRPVVTNFSVGPELMSSIRTEGQMPTLYFVDPFGYKGLSLRLIGGALSGWGCDVIFYFNYNRINPGLSNPVVASHMADLFGQERFARLRDRVEKASPRERQGLILAELIETLKEVGGRYVLAFEFQSEHGSRTSHYIIFVSKNRTGYEIMKEIMHKLSSDDAEVREFVFVPIPSAQMRLPGDIDRQYSIPVLRSQLARLCAGKELTMREIYETYSLDTPYLKKHFKTALDDLDLAGEITVDVPRSKRLRGGKATMGDGRVITFPE